MPPRFLRLHQKTGFISWNKTWTSLPRIYRSWWREKGCRQREILFRPRHRHLIFSSMEYLTWGIKRNRGRKTGLQLFQQRPHIEPPRTSLIARIWEIRRSRSHKMDQSASFYRRLILRLTLTRCRQGRCVVTRVKITLSIQAEGQCLKLVPFQTCVPSGWQWSEADAGTRRAGASGGTQVTFFCTMLLFGAFFRTCEFYGQ